jgi:hypothetical protein
MTAAINIGISTRYANLPEFTTWSKQQSASLRNYCSRNHLISDQVIKCIENIAKSTHMH